MQYTRNRSGQASGKGCPQALAHSVDVTGASGSRGKSIGRKGSIQGPGNTNDNFH